MSGERTGQLEGTITFVIIDTEGSARMAGEHPDHVGPAVDVGAPGA